MKDCEGVEGYRKSINRCGRSFISYHMRSQCSLRPAAQHTSRSLRPAANVGQNIAGKCEKNVLTSLFLAHTTTARNIEQSKRGQNIAGYQPPNGPPGTRLITCFWRIFFTNSLLKQRMARAKSRWYSDSGELLESKKQTQILKNRRKLCASHKVPHSINSFLWIDRGPDKIP